MTSSRTQDRHDPLKLTRSSPLTATVSLLKFVVHSQLKFKQKHSNWEFTHTHTPLQDGAPWARASSAGAVCARLGAAAQARATFILPLGLCSPSTLLSSPNCPSTPWSQWPHRSLFCFIFLTTAAVRATDFMGSQSLTVSCESQSFTGY